jgi:hypothetical protein
MTLNSRGLSDRQRAVVATMRMKLNEEEAMAYLRAEGHPMSVPTWYRIKAWLKRTQLQRLHFIAAIGFENQHTTRIDTCELIEKLMWENYNLCQSPFKRVIILEKILNLQPILSAYYDTTRWVLEKRRERQWEKQERENQNRDNQNNIDRSRPTST